MKNLFKKSLITILSLLMVFSFSSIRSVKANESTNDELERQIIEKMEKEGISKEKQLLLIEKIRNGQLPDSVTGNVTVTPIVIKNFNGDIEYKYYYPDGSFSITTVSKEQENNIIPFSVDGGNLNSGNSWWERRNMRIHHDFLVGTLGFYAHAGGDQNNAIITSVFDEWATGYFGVTFAIPTLQKIDNNHAVLKANITSTGGFSSRYMKLHFYIYGVNNYYSKYQG